MELLIIGAGAIGSVYGYYASLAGAQVSYLVKPKYRADLEKGLTLYHWKGRHTKAIEFKNYAVFGSAEELATKKFDAVLVTVPSDKLRSGDWFENLLPKIGSAKIWSLQSNASDIDWIASKMGADAYDRLAWGRIPLMSYLAPLPGEAFEKTGYAFYLPPGARALWTAKKKNLAEEPAHLFSSGGLRSKTTEVDFRSSGLFEESFLRILVAGLERSEWSLDRLMNGENIYLVKEGLRETSAILAKYYKTPDPSKKAFGKLGSTLFGLRSTVKVAKALIPFDLETFLRVHFTKVEGQMHAGLNELIEMGKRNKLSTTSLSLLQKRKKTLNQQAVDPSQH